MAEAIIIFSKEPLDPEVFSRYFDGLGKTAMTESMLLFYFDDGRSSYELYFGYTDLGDFTPEQIAHIELVTGIVQPCATALVHRHRMPDEFLLRLPAWDDVWISEEGDFIFSLKEVQQRIRLGVEYMGRAEREAGAELVVHHKGQAVGGAIVVLDDGTVSDARQREAIFQEKLMRCAAYFGSSESVRFVADSSNKKPLIEALCILPPTPAMKAITSVSDSAHPEFVLPVEFVTEEEFGERHGFVPRDLPSLRDRY